MICVRVIYLYVHFFKLFFWTLRTACIFHLFSCSGIMPPTPCTVKRKMLASECFERSPGTDHLFWSPSFSIPTANKIYSKLINKVKTGGGENLSTHSKRERRQADEEEKKTREGLVAWEMVILVKKMSGNFIKLTKAWNGNQKSLYLRTYERTRLQALSKQSLDTRYINKPGVNRFTILPKIFDLSTQRISLHETYFLITKWKADLHDMKDIIYG